MLRLWVSLFGQSVACALVTFAGISLWKSATVYFHDPPAAKRVMHTFFAAGRRPEKEALETLSAWQFNWRRAGWKTRILTEKEARHSRLYNMMSEVLANATVKQVAANGKHVFGQHERTLYLRYVAMAAVGGGWMSDWDTLPTHFAPGAVLPNNGTFTVFQGHIPSLVSGYRQEYERVSSEMMRLLQAQQGPVDNDEGPYSDRLALRDLVKNGAVRSEVDVILADTWPMFPKKFPCEMAAVHNRAVHFSTHAIETLGFFVNARGALMNRSMDRWWECTHAAMVVP
mmetsp:Transcript_15937/g.29970  ORF Transcript_15937/g.29970 Transcript_15937/m.29970 type:complete len:285 (+) Transcript_15937:85-939(+)